MDSVLLLALMDCVSDRPVFHQMDSVLPLALMDVFPIDLCSIRWTLCCHWY